ncbi:monovalent cation/H+ antiporter complex subunit F [Rhodococcoides fascians]|uniref:monovalent cation/H+ antiporter complex subunit F n=1 Tax=Rhodococcoides fascians TaxID=1828 RepID=UPI000564718E|nr:monovalent cation/H+ antiporter complex subunit F [Rhodococcus fascians]
MIGVDIGIVLVAVTVVLAAARMILGPTDADRAIAADLLFFATIALVALCGVRAASSATFDIVLIATVVGFLAALSLARALTKGLR